MNVLVVLKKYLESRNKSYGCQNEQEGYQTIRS